MFSFAVPTLESQFITSINSELLKISVSRLKLEQNETFLPLKSVLRFSSVMHNKLILRFIFQGRSCDIMEQKIKMKELNEFITCSICSGYLINASTVTECLHTCTFSIPFKTKHSA